MECKNCGAQLKADDRICGECGRVVADWKPELDFTEEQDVPATADAAQENEEPADEEAVEQVPPAKKNTGLIVAVAACAVIILALIAVLVSGGKAPADEVVPGEQETTAADPETDSSIIDVTDPVGGEVPVYAPAVSYTIDDAAAFDEALLAEVIATCGDRTLTNETLAYYYWREAYSFFSSYSSYLSYLMDPTARLDQQESIIQGKSWDEMFMDAALESFHTYAAACAKGNAANYELTESEIQGLENMEGELQSYADLYGYESSDMYVQVSFGPYTNVESYKSFMQEYIYGASYLEHLLAQEEYTEEDLLAFYEENREDYEAAGLVYDDRKMVTIRHILIQPEAVTLTEGEDGYEEAVQAALDAAKEEAQAIYDLWMTDPTEDHFALLAQEHSADGSAAYGGLIEQIYPGQTVENFDAWCFAEGRQEGEHGLVESEFGYHIIFLSSFCEQSYWNQVISNEYENKLFAEICEELRAEYALEVDLTKAAVYPANITLNPEQSAQ